MYIDLDNLDPLCLLYGCKSCVCCSTRPLSTYVPRANMPTQPCCVTEVGNCHGRPITWAVGRQVGHDIILLIWHCWRANQSPGSYLFSLLARLKFKCKLQVESHTSMMS